LTFLPDTYSSQTVLQNFGRSIVQFAAEAEKDDAVLLCYDRDALLELGVMLLHMLRERAKEKVS
jgi:hypothetical protein